MISFNSIILTARLIIIVLLSCYQLKTYAEKRDARQNFGQLQSSTLPPLIERCLFEQISRPCCVMKGVVNTLVRGRHGHSSLMGRLLSHYSAMNAN